MKAQKAKELEIQNDELRQLNDDLLQELQKRDVAVEEAVALICDFEARIQQLEAENLDQNISVGMPTTAMGRAGGQSRQTPEPSVVSSPPHATSKTSELAPETTFKRPYTPSPSRAHKQKQNATSIRSPSFLSDSKPSTSALRELFTKQDEGSTANGTRLAKPSMRSLRRVGSFFSQDEFPEPVDGDPFSLDPRRLSLLSESSFVSVYGKDKEKTTPSMTDREATITSKPSEGDVAFTRKLSPQEGRIKHWIESKDHPATPSSKSVQSGRSDAFSSIGEVLRPNHPKALPILPSISSTPSDRPRQIVSPQLLGKQDRNVSLAGPMFGRDVLPPTPGTMSTATFGGRSSSHSVATEGSLNGGFSRPTSGTTAVSLRTHILGSTGKDNAPQSAVTQQHPYENDTDIEVSDDGQPFVEAEPKTRDGFNGHNNRLSVFSHGVSPVAYGGSAVDAVNSRGPLSRSPCTDFMFNGEDIESIRPARTMHSSSSTSSNSSGTTTDSSREHARMTGRNASGQKGTSSARKPLRHRRAFD